VRWFDPNKIWPEIRLFVEHLAAGIVILLGFWIAGWLTGYLIRRFGRRMPHSAGLLDLLARTAKIAVVALGGASALGTIGIDISALVAGLGLTGFALGFAFRDVLSNLLSGILLLLFRPFGPGDHISVTGLDGEVTSIDLRYTVLKQPGKIVLIPNSNLFTNPILVDNQPPAKP
jgi:small conductance mechanosensitive channel